MTVSVGIVGYGYWGPNLARNVQECPATRLVGVADARAERLKVAGARHPGAKLVARAEELFADPDIDAVAIATPVSTHHALAMAALKAGKHVLVEKPLASNPEHCLELIEAARRAGRVLMVDHTFVYTGAVRLMKKLVATGAIGVPRYFDSTRVNLGLFQKDVNVLWDLAVHDLSILDHVIDDRPVAVSATGISHVAGRPENTAYLTLFYPRDFIAHVHVNWLAPVKVRRTLIGGDRKMIIYDDLEPDEKIKIYDKGISESPSEKELHEIMIGYRTGDIHSPQVDAAEALAVEIRHFAECVGKGASPESGAEQGLRLVRVLDAASRSIAGRGAPVEIPRD